MVRVRSFPAIGDDNAHTLILGTMPGAASLAARQYYAHPRNAFWPIVAHVFGFDADLEYHARVRRLADAGVAVWDVLKSCERAGSLDSRIEPASVVVNDFRRFFATHRRIERVYFNGGNAQALFRRHVLPSTHSSSLTFVRLPSTSPANASIRPDAKLRAWRAHLATAALHNAVPPAVP
jgi:TDG/mug DNA glycosylase family protein